MGSNVDNSTHIQNSITNDYLQESSNVCETSAVSDSSGNVAIIAGSVGGDVDIDATSQANSMCSMSNNVSQLAQTSISNMGTQIASAETDFLGDLQFSNVTNKDDIYTSITNRMTQISTNACYADSSAATNNNFVYVTTTGSVGGNVNFTSSASAESSCSMLNAAKMTAYNQVANTIDQTAKYTGMFALMINTMLTVIIVIAVVIVVLFATCEIGSVFKARKCGDAGCQQGTNWADVALIGMDKAEDFAKSGQAQQMYSAYRGSSSK